MTFPFSTQTAVERSREIRSGRAELKNRIASSQPHAGRSLAADFIENPTTDLRGMSVYALVTACPGIGKTAYRTLYDQCRVDPWHQELGDLTVRERLALGRALRTPRARETRAA
jgi:hypothetical protein